MTNQISDNETTPTVFTFTPAECEAAERLAEMVPKCSHDMTMMVNPENEAAA